MNRKARRMVRQLHAGEPTTGRWKYSVVAWLTIAVFVASAAILIASI